MKAARSVRLDQDLRAELATWRATGARGWETVSELLAARLGAVSLLYRPGDMHRPHRVLATHGVSAQGAQTALSSLTQSITYDPRGVATRDQNRVSLKDDLVRKGDFTPEKLEHWWRVSRRVFGTPIVDQVRLLVCEGPTALAWVGAVQFDPDRPFTEVHRRLLRRHAAAFIERMQLHARLEQEPLVEATLEALLAHCEQPTWLLDARGAVVLANSAATARWDRRRAETAEALEQVSRGDARGFRVAEVRVPGLPRYQLVMARGERADVGSRLNFVVSQWALTPTEAAVLACVVRGLTTDAIATELQRSRRTVELYVTRLMTKARVDNRASLIAKVWCGA